MSPNDVSSMLIQTNVTPNPHSLHAVTLVHDLHIRKCNAEPRWRWGGRSGARRGLGAGISGELTKVRMDMVSSIYRGICRHGVMVN